MKLKELLDTQTRVSMLQTAMNVSGSNFQGKAVVSKKLLGYAFELYSGMVNQIIATENGKIIKPTVKTMSKKSTQDLLNRVAKKSRKKKK